MTIEIRELSEPQEVSALEPMVLEYFRIVFGHLKTDFDIQLSPQDPTSNMMETPEKFIAPLGRGYVAESDGVLVGMIFLKPLRGTDFEVKRLYLRSEARGLGLGKRLVRHAIKAARDLGANDLYLDSIPSLRAAISLYESEGFTHIEPYSGSEVAANDMIRPLGVYMHLSLNPSPADTKS